MAIQALGLSLGVINGDDNVDGLSEREGDNVKSIVLLAS
jgi:hypothetical protein